MVEAGFSRSRIDCWLRNGRLIKVVRGVYSYGRDVETREAVWRASLVAAGPGSILTGRSACEAWGIIQARDTVPAQVEVATTTGCTRTLHGASPALRRIRINIRKRQFDRSDVRQKGGVELASPVLALIEFAAEASERGVRFAFLEACRLNLFNRRDVRDCHDRLEGRRGAGKLKPLLALWVPQLGRIRSVLEGRILLGLIECRLPLPEVNVKVGGYEVDFFWQKYGVVLEADGETYHSDPPQRAIDAAKQRDLEQRGLEVMRVTSRQFDRNSDAVLDEVAHKLRSRGADSGLVGK
ncbi:MAG: DUF559 domain-containing protein [Solirubrobacterales bacterium]|nr:DUF559 domain-containing protein [Solirubrobacterales bacterium]